MTRSQILNAFCDKQKGYASSEHRTDGVSLEWYHYTLAKWNGDIVILYKREVRKASYRHYWEELVRLLKARSIEAKIVSVID